MEQDTQAYSTPSSPRVYVTAPASPNAYGRNGSMESRYYSAPSSPRRKTGDAAVCIGDSRQKTSYDPTSEFDDDFEFETSKKFSGQLSFGTSQNLDYSLAGDDPMEGCLGHGDSVPAMAFADELFFNGLVMPLKLPPRLQYDSDFSSVSRTSPVLSPRSPRTMCRIPLSRRNAWKTDFDPFMVALQKVREEKTGRNGSHRRSRSYSPFRATTKCSSDIGHSSRDSGEGNGAVQVQVPALSFSGPLDFKGSSYARWVRNQTREGGINPKKSRSPRAFLFGQRVRPVKAEHDGPDKQTSARGKNFQEKCGKVNEESKVQKLKGIIMRYASFGRQTKIHSEVRKTSYLSRLSFKFKGNAHGNGRKSKLADKEMAVVEYKPSVALCLGYGIGSPRKMNKWNNI